MSLQIKYAAKHGLGDLTMICSRGPFMYNKDGFSFDLGHKHYVRISWREVREINTYRLEDEKFTLVLHEGDRCTVMDKADAKSITLLNFKESDRIIRDLKAYGVLEEELQNKVQKTQDEAKQDSKQRFPTPCEILSQCTIS